MKQEKAMSEVKARVRDFSAWLPTCKDREQHPYPEEGASLAEMAAYLQATLPLIGKADPGAWEPGGWKRVELEEALAALGLPALMWQNNEE